ATALTAQCGNGSLHLQKCLIWPPRQGFPDKNHPRLGTGRKIGHEIGLVPPLVSIDDKNRLRRGGANCGYARGVALAAKLDLEQGAAGSFFRRFCHCIWSS